MNWITTNIRFPEDVYMELKLEAARQRRSVADIVRERVTKKNTPGKKSLNRLMKELDRLATETARQNKGIDFTKGLIEMRYEQ